MAQSQPYLIQSLIGGISEQSPQDRPSSTCDDQENCLNDPLNGCIARPGGVVLGSTSFSMTDPFVHDIRRSSTEHYKVFIENGQMMILNIIDGTVCSRRNFKVFEPYLRHTGPARLAFDAVTVEDSTFIVNRQVTAKMSNERSPRRPNRGLFYFKSGAYSTTYKAKLTVGESTYSASYTTPDNTDEGNAAFITTNRLAAEMRDAFAAIKDDVAPALNHFSFTVSGSNVVITCDNNTVFELDSEDGAGDTHLLAIGEWVKKFDDLPSRAPNGYVVGVRGSKADQKDDYWLKYNGPEVTGYWSEVVSPNTKTELNAETMPHVLRNVAKNSFSCTRGKWSKRISGDGVISAKDPNFVGRRIRSINFIAGRLALNSEGTFMLSRARNAYCFFPDTAQTRLDTDPIGFDIATGSVTVVKSAVAVSGKLFLWGDGNQLRLDSGDQVLNEESADCIPSTNYEFDGKYTPVPQGMGSVIFGTAFGGTVKLKEVMYRNGAAFGEIPLNDHCPKVVSGVLKQIAVGNTAGVLVVLTSDDTTAYIYQWLNQAENRVQTAWNKWTFTGITRIVSGTVRGSYLYLLFQIGSKLVTERFDMDTGDLSLRDIRLDHRVTEEGASYGSGLATLTLPYVVPTDDRSFYVTVYNEDDDTGTFGASPLDFEWLSSSQIRVTMPSDDPTGKFFFGAKPKAATRRFSQLYVQTRTGTLLPDRNLVASIRISHMGTSEYRLLVEDHFGATIYDHEFHGRQAITPTPNNKLSKTKAGEYVFSVDRKSDEVVITLINDTIYPSRWVQAEYQYAATKS